MRLHCVLVLCEQQSAFYKESFVFTCLTYGNVQCFRNGPVHDIYGLKASQMRKVRASSHKYPHIENIKDLREQNFLRVRQTKNNLIVRILNEATSVVNI